MSAKWESGPNLHTTPHLNIVKDVFRWENGQQLAKAVLMTENGGGPCVNARLQGLKEEFYFANKCERQFYFMCEF